MALQTSVLTEFGVYATYWNIGAVFSDYRSKTADIILVGYADGESRRLGSKPLAIRKVTLSGAQYIDDGTRADWYRQLRLLEEFSAAANV